MYQVVKKFQLPSLSFYNFFFGSWLKYKFAKEDEIFTYTVNDSTINISVLFDFRLVTVKQTTKAMEARTWQNKRSDGQNNSSARAF